MRQALTDSLLKGTAKPPRGRIELADLKCTGLEFRITDKGARSFSYRFRCPASGRIERMTLGRYPDLTLADARGRADEYRGKVAKGINPAQERKRVRSTAAARSFGAVSERYLTEHAKRKKRASSAKEDERNLKLHVLPHWHNRHIDTIERADVIEIAERLVSQGKGVMANRIQSLVSKVFSFAVDAGVTKTNPCHRLSKRAAETPASRVLSDDETRQFWPRVIHSPLTRRSGLALRLILLTGVRPGEAAGLHRSELENLDQPGRALWIVPGNRTKNGRTHAVPLSEPAREAIAAAIELIPSGEAFVFASPSKRGQPMRPHSLTVALKRLASVVEGAGSETWKASLPTPHDLRRTVATRLASLGTPREDVSAVLNHVPQGVTGRVYDHYERLAEKRRALTAWAEHLRGILNGAAHG